MQFKSLRAQLLFFFLPLLIGVQLVTLLLMNTTASDIGSRYSGQQLNDATGVVSHYFAAQRATWLNAGKMIAADIEVQEALKANETTRLNSLLERYRTTLNVNHIAVASDASATKQHDQDFIRTRRGIYHQVMVPIGQGDASAWLRLAKRLDSSTASELRGITNTHITFLDGASQGIQLTGTSHNPLALNGNELEQKSVEQLAAELTSDFAPLLAERTAFADGPVLNKATETIAIRLGDAKLQMFAVLQPTSDHASTAMASLRSKLTLLVIAGLLLSVQGGIMLARTITRPVQQLANFAKDIQLGNYTKTVEIEREDEIGDLAYTLNVMTQAIALREDEMMHMAYSDTLTNLPNRAMYNERLARAVDDRERQPTPFTIMMIDLDRFKFINDVLGHECGDFALRIVAKRLLSVMRKSDTVARLGGDEFGIILPTGDRRKVQDIARKVLQVLEQPISMENQQVDLGGSIGIASFPAHGREASVLLRHADVAMYEAKRSGIGYSFFDPNSDTYQQTHLSLLGDIRKAVGNGEFELFYQPKVGLKKADIPNMEVLIRWNHPERGFIPPDEFIPFAEHTGSIRLITHWVIDSAIRKAGQWHSEGRPVKISVNVSSRDLLNPNLSDIVDTALKRSGLPVEYLCLEITESALMDDPDKARAMVQTLHDMGIRLSIDDYGTGYSSLAYVANLPVDELKIDKAFVNNMLESAEDSAIVRSTIELGHYLQMVVIAEGIEEQAELARLREYGCDYVQGYMVCKPMDEATMIEWVESKEWRNYASLHYEEPQLPKAANE